MNFKKVIGNNIREIRLSRNVTIRQLHHKINSFKNIRISKRELRKLEEGAYPHMDIFVYYAIATRLKVSLHSLFIK